MFATNFQTKEYFKFQLSDFQIEEVPFGFTNNSKLISLGFKPLISFGIRNNLKALQYIPFDKNPDGKGKIIS